MRPILRRLHSPDASDLRAYVPESPGHFGLLIQALIGPAEGKGEESFDFIYCSPSWIKEQVDQNGPLWSRHHLVDTSFDFQRLHRSVEKICQGIDRPNWNEVGERLGRYGHWEFEDYNPHSTP